MRKHFYLITEHEDEDRVGGVSVFDRRLQRPTKNAEAAITVLDKDEQEFRDVGKQVALGYHDFEDEDAYNDNDLVSERMQAKVRSVDREWAEKAGIAEVVYDE